ncbi:MAG TPA: acyl-CoA thioesterase [Albitalea sp.]
MPSPRRAVYRLRVEFGDCDPAGIVWFPNFFRWIDAASRHFFVECGVPPWHELERSTGIIGTPLVDTRARFVKSASYGDVLDIETAIVEWRRKSFVQRHRVVRGDDLLMECTEVRVFAVRRSEAEGGGIKAVVPPEGLRGKCS